MASPLHAQNILSKEVLYSCNPCSRQEALVAISKESGINIVFSDHFFQRCSPISIPEGPKRLDALLDQIGSCGRLSYKIIGDQVVFYQRSQRVTLSGFVRDADSGERILGASIRFSGNKGVGAITNEFGFFSISSEAGDYNLYVSCIGYKSQLLNVSLNSDEKISISLQPFGQLPEVLISGKAPDSTRWEGRSEMQHQLPLGKLGYLPMPGGESDLMRLVAFETGVQTGVDGLGGLHIRGGNADQNLILLDDVPVYNPSHSLGLFSIFNPSTLSQAQLFKGDFPARYGGRAASVLDVRTRDGNSRSFHAQASVGLLASTLTLEGPIVKDRSALLFSTRFTYFQPWVHFLSQRENLITFSGQDTRYRFNDVNLKWNTVLNDKNRVFLTIYSGGDLFDNVFEQSKADLSGIATDRYALALDWGNRIAAFRWNRVLGNRLFSNTTVRYSKFYYSSKLNFTSSFLYPNGKESTLANYAQLYQTLIRDWSVKTDFTFYSRSWMTVRWGLSQTFHIFQPGALAVNFLIPGQSDLGLDSLNAILLNNQRLKASSTEAYCEASWKINAHWKADLGLNGSVFQIDRTNYPNLLPRLRLGRNGERGWSHWMYYNRMAQNLHQIGSFNISLPFELWVPSTSKVPPELVGQLGLGSSWNRGPWSFSVDAYLKQMDRALAFLSTNDALFSGGAEDASGWEDRIAIGSGKSKGIELELGYTQRIVNLKVAYTLSEAVRQFPDINSGNVFPFRFDRRHDLKVVWHQRISNWLSTDVDWVFATGNPITLTGVKYQHHTPEGEVVREVAVYTQVNAYRLPAYHRLDVSARASWTKGLFEHNISLGVYNAYNRANPFFLYLDTGSGLLGNAIQYTLLPVLPIFRYELKF